MHVRLAHNIQLECESFGNPEAPAILLIMGLGAQLLRWNIEICDGLVAAGYRVIRVDNRDCGLSTRFDEAPIPADLAEIIAGAPARLVDGGWLFLEHGYDQAASARGLLADAGFAAIASWKDLAGIERVSGGRWLGRSG